MGALAAVALLTMALPGTAQDFPERVNARPLGDVIAQAPQKWVRKDGRYWTYYVPDAKWRGVDNASGIDVSSPTGDYYMGHGFVGGLLGPATHEQVLELVKQGITTGARTLDMGALQDAGSPTQGVTRKTADFTATRLDNGAQVRGTVTIDIHRYDAQGVYGFANWVRLMPAADHAKWDPVLKQMQSLLFYKGRGPSPTPAPAP